MFSIDEYFNKSGFGDGDDAAALAAGYQHRDRAIQLLNEAFSELNLPVRATACEVATVHNPCQIELSVGKDVLAFDHGTWDEDELEVFELTQASLEQAIALARNRFS